MTELEKLKQQNEVMDEALKRIEYQPHYGMVDGMMSGWAKEARKECFRIKREYYRRRRLTNESK